MPTPDLSVIIVSHNTRDLLTGCLRSLRRVSDEAVFEVIVVDNASSDGSASRVTEAFPEVRLVMSESNVGFAKAVNMGAEIAVGKSLFMLNPDTLVPRRTIQRLLGALMAADTVAVVGAQLTFPNGEPQPSTFKFPSLFREFWNFLPEVKYKLGLSNMASVAAKFRQKSQLNSSAPNPSYSVPCVSGAAMMVRASVFRALGGFDPHFFLYHEEIDFCRKVWRGGHQVRFVPKAQVIHFDAQSSGLRRGSLPSLPVLEWRIAGMDRYWAKHKTRKMHRLWRMQARSLLQLRIAALFLARWFGDAHGQKRVRMAELRRVKTILAEEKPD